MSNIVSYTQILKDIQSFKNSGNSASYSEFNKFDFPNHKYFKILFHFGDVDEKSYNELGNSNGLLHPTWEIWKPKESEGMITILDKITPYYNNLEKFTGLYRYNSAWSYLMFNGEYERAAQLKDFILTLSNINAYSPWYFNSISGVDAALERKCANNGGKLDLNERKVLSIQCLPDAFDNRIQTLLELYRDITWSWVHKKEILPANLRKFDMSILIFESPIKFWHGGLYLRDDITEEDLNDESSNNSNNMCYKNDYINIIIDKYGNKSFKEIPTLEKVNGKFLRVEKPSPAHSYKLLEFHDCEFNFNSLKSGFNQVNNKEGFTPTFTIDISYADCYESSYNEFMGKELGDFIISDLFEKRDVEDLTGGGTLLPDTQDTDNNINITLVRNNNDMKLFTPFKSKAHDFGNLEVNPFIDEEKLRYQENGRKHSHNAGFSPGFITNALGQVVEQAKTYVMNVDVPWLGDKSINDIRLGNIYGGTSISGIKSFASNLLKGNVMGSFYSIKDYINDNNKEQASKTSNADISLGNIATNKTPDNVETHDVRNIGNSNGMSRQQLAAAKMGKLNTNNTNKIYKNNI